MAKRLDGLPRDDAYPEGTDYRDTGCDVHPACLTCPLPACKYDYRGGRQELERIRRNLAILARRRAGAAVDELIAEFGLSRRSIFRIFKAAGE